MPPEEGAMPDVSGPGDSTPAGRSRLPPTAGLDGLKYRTAAEAALEHESPAAHRVGWGFVSLYTLAYISTSLLFIAPLLVTLALKVNSLVGIERAPDSLALVAGVAALLAMVGNPFFGKMSDRTSSRLGMRRPWMVRGLVGGSLGILVVALAPSIAVVLVGWCLAQLLFNALLAAMVAVLPDQVPAAQRGLVAGVLGVCTPIASVSGTFLVKLFTGSQLAMFLAPCAIGGFFILLFAVTLKDRRLAKTDKPAWSMREFASTFYVNPRKNPDFAWHSPAASCLFWPMPSWLPTRPTTCWKRSAAPRPRYRSRYSWAHSSSPSSSSPLPSSAASSLTGRAGGKSSCSPRRSCTAWRCS
jgi:MFS family permease